MLNLVWVRSFLALIERRSFQAAAEALNLAQPTVSLHIQKLEEQLGAVLFRRARTGCMPTGDALAFLPHAESMIRLNDRALALAGRRQVRIGASSNVGIYILQPYLGRFLHGRDPASVDIVIDRNPAIASKLENSELDVAVMEWWDGRDGLQAAAWRAEPVVVIVPPGHELAGRSGIDGAALAGFEMLGGESGTGTGRLLARYFGTSGAMPRVSRQLGSTEAVKQAVRAGLGISLVLEASVRDEVAAGSLVAIPFAAPPLRKDLYVAWRPVAGRRPDFAEHLLTAGRA